jgi:DNA-binding transcriptional regulator WhiA
MHCTINPKQEINSADKKAMLDELCSALEQWFHLRLQERRLSLRSKIGDFLKSKRVKISGASGD